MRLFKDKDFEHKVVNGIKNLVVVIVVVVVVVVVVAISDEVEAPILVQPNLV